MNQAHAFDIDLEYTRSLARDLDVAAAFIPPQPAVMTTDSTLADFVRTLNQALDTPTTSSQQFPADVAHVARSGFALADAAEVTDSAASSASDGFQVGYR